MFKILLATVLLAFTVYAETKVHLGTITSLTWQSAGTGKYVGIWSTGTPVMPSPIAWYKMDDNASSTTVIDSSGNGYTGMATTTTDTLAASGVLDGCFDFAGLNYFTSSEIQFSNATGWSISVWVLQYGLANWENPNRFGIVGDVANSGAGLIIDGYNNNIRFITSSGYIADPSTLIENTWIHYVFVYDGSSLNMFRDGVLVASGAGGGMTTELTALTLGYREVSGAWYGLLDDFRVYAQALTATQAEDLYWSYSPEPIAYYKLDDALESWDVLDSVGTVNGTATSYTVGLTTPGQVGTAFNFGAGTGDKVTVPNSALDFDGSKPFSVSCWIKHRIAWDNPVVIGTGAPNLHTMNGWALHLYAGGPYFTLNAGTYYTENEVQSRSQGMFTSTTEDNWAFLCVAYDGSKTATGIKFYKNGVLANDYYGNDTDSFTGNCATSGDLRIANNSEGSSQFMGIIDDVRIFDFELTGQQAQDIWAGRPITPGKIVPSEPPPPPTTVTTYFDMNGANGYLEYSSYEYSPGTLFGYMPYCYSYDGWTFNYWRDSSYTVYDANSTVPSSSITLYADWAVSPTPPTIYFDAISYYPGDAYADGVYADSGSYVYYYGYIDYLPSAYTSNGSYYFVGWRDQYYSFYSLYGTPHPDGTTLYAEWASY